MITFKEVNKTELNMQMLQIIKQLKKINDIEFVKTSNNFILEIRYKGFLLGHVEYHEDAPISCEGYLFFTINETNFSNFGYFKVSPCDIYFIPNLDIISILDIEEVSIMSNRFTTFPT